MPDTTSWNVPSPDETVDLAVSLDAAGVPRYAVRYGGTGVLAPSALGLELAQGGLLTSGLRVLDTARASHEETYALLAGKASTPRDPYNELTLTLQEQDAPGRRLTLVFRAFNDGVALRYVVPAQDALAQFQVVAEHTEFRFPADHRCWAQTADGFQTSFEGEFHPLTLSKLTPQALIILPLTLQTEDGPALAITEAALSDYSGMYVQGLSTDDGHALVSRLSPRLDDPALCVRAHAPHATPWRILQIAPTPAQLIESTLVLSLNAPQSPGDFGWVRPGKVLWDWWAGDVVTDVDFTGGMNDATMQHYIDFAAEFGLEYMLIDGGWYGPSNTPAADLTRSVPDIHLPELVQYANARGVDVLVWMHWQDTRHQLEKAFAYYQSINVKGVKVDFFDRDDQEVVAYIQNLVETAARHRLMVDLHGVYKPTGLQRTWPNLMTHEGILGAEYNKWSTRVTPTHNVTIPYTRMLAGPMDYTPGGFRSVTPETFEARNKAPLVMGTRCHQLAMYVVYESALQMVSDYPGAVRGQDGAEFLRAAPAAWDETRALGGAVGEWVALARRRGADWFVGAMTNEQGRAVTLSLDFLGDGAYTAVAYVDGPDAAQTPTQLTTSTKTVTRADTLDLTLASAGGAAVHIRPRRKG